MLVDNHWPTWLLLFNTGSQSKLLTVGPRVYITTRTKLATRRLRTPGRGGLDGCPQVEEAGSELGGWLLSCTGGITPSPDNPGEIPGGFELRTEGTGRLKVYKVSDHCDFGLQRKF